jgi:hypothetical protein
MQFDCLNTYILQSNKEIKNGQEKMVIVGCYIHQCVLPQPFFKSNYYIKYYY